MSAMFEAGNIKEMQVRNRIVRSATFEGLANFEGRPSDALKKIYFDLADGQVGLIITGAAFVDRYRNLPDIPGLPFALAIDDDMYIDDWSSIVQGVHARGACIAMQIVHPGRLDIPDLRGGPAISPSAVVSADGKISPREMTLEEIESMIERFAQACSRAKAAGFDGVQLHGGHGYLISNFISPYLNQRQDAYGGNTKNRARFIVNIINRARALVGEQFPILIKMNCDDFVPNGLRIEEATRVAAIVAEAGIDCIEVTGGIGPESEMHAALKGINRPEKEALLKPFAAMLKDAVDIPIVLMGGLRSVSVIEKMLEDRVADFVSMSRPLIREPALVSRWLQGDRSKATCVSCSQCIDNVFKRPIRCYVEEKLKEKQGI